MIKPCHLMGGSGLSFCRTGTELRAFAKAGSKYQHIFEGIPLGRACGLPDLPL